MSFQACKAALRTAIQGITPTWRSRDGFVTNLTSDGGNSVRLEDMKEGFRYFEVISAGLPQEATESLRTCRVRQEVLIRVRYELTQDVDQLDTLIAQDVCSIREAIRKPSNWNQGTSTMSALQMGAEIDLVPLGDDEAPNAVIVPIPVTIIYRSC